jgi:uncharacterized protein
LVDLHSIARQSIRAGIEHYSLKELEPFHDFRRETPLKEASIAKRVLERALELSVPDKIDDQSKQIVESYNRDDCVSALRLRDWLETLRKEAMEKGANIERPSLQSGDPTEALGERQQRVQALVERLTADVPADPAERSEEQRARWLLAYLLDYHRREEKASFWELFRLRDLENEAYLDEKSAIGELTFVAQLEGNASTPVHRYTFPRQEIGFRHGKGLRIKDESSTDWSKTRSLGTVQAIDPVARTIDIKKTRASKDTQPSGAFVDPVRLTSDPRPGALLELGDWVAGNGIDSPGPFRAGRDLLLRRSPRMSGDVTCEQIQGQNESATEAATMMGGLLQEGIVPIQGPPGAGKTYTGARMICELVRSGKKVGVTSLSHKVIGNLLKETVDAARKSHLPLRCCQRVRELDDGFPPEITQTTNGQPLDAFNSGEAQVGAGTAWVWARPEYEEAVDVLFIDEAGQMPLADVLAVSRAAKSLVLLGDPAQLDQPQQGSHPDGVAVSALQHLLGKDRTLPNDRGLFLPRTYRLHPEICKFTSEVFYEGKLKSRPGLDRQALVGDTPFAGSGLWFVPVEHEANQNSSSEEVDEVERIVRSLIEAGVEWINGDGENQRLTLDDILIVAPYTVQVSDLLSRLPQGARVGTVDKFQGQQAPVVIYSMTTSSPEDAPRGMEFLYSLNRLNVATSRARCASILVASERLLEPECRTPRQMRLANALCRYIELAREVRPGDDTRRRGAAVGEVSG